MALAIWTVSFRRTKGAPLERTAIAERSSHLARVAWSTPGWWSRGEVPDYYSAECYPIPLHDLFDLSTTEIK